MTGTIESKAPPRQQIIAMLLAAGKYTVPEIAASVGVDLSVIYALQESELFQALVEGFRKRYTPAEIDEVRALLRLDAPKNFEFLKSIREGDIPMGLDPKVLAMRMRASEVLFDKQVPKQAATEAGPRIVVNIDATRLAQLRTVMAEDEARPAIDVERDSD